MADPKNRAFVVLAGNVGPYLAGEHFAGDQLGEATIKHLLDQEQIAEVQPDELPAKVFRRETHKTSTCQCGVCAPPEADDDEPVAPAKQQPPKAKRAARSHKKQAAAETPAAEAAQQPAPAAAAAE